VFQIPGLEDYPAAKYVIAFAIIFVLLTLFALVLRRVTGGRLTLPGQGTRTRQPRLGIVDVYDLDRQRQLILLRRDNVEHLLLIGGPNDVVIETNIVRAAGARAAPGAVEAGDFREPPPELAPPAPARPVVEPAAARPEPVAERVPPRRVEPPVPEPAPERPAPRRAEPPPPEPVAERPAPRPRVEPTAAEPVAVSATLQPTPLQTEPVLKPNVVALTPPDGEAARRAESEARAARRAAPAPAPPPRPNGPVPLRPAAPPATRDAPPPPAAAEEDSPAAGGDAAILSDMAKQLEEALKRPLAPTRPVAVPLPSGPPPAAGPAAAGPAAAPMPPATRAPPPPRPAPASPKPSAPAAAAPRAERPAAPPPVAAPPRPPEPSRVAEDGPPPRGAVEPPSARSLSEPPSLTRHPPPAPAPARAPDPEPDAAQAARAADPFSVEEIEAEFARLLGRPFEKSDKGEKT